MYDDCSALRLKQLSLITAARYQSTIAVFVECNIVSLFAPPTLLLTPRIFSFIQSQMLVIAPGAFKFLVPHGPP